MPSGYKKDSRRTEDLLDKEKYTAALIKTADAAVELAQQVAPVGTITHTTKGGYVNKPGDYKRGLKVVVRGGKVYATAQDWKSHWVEFGSVNQNASAPLRRGLQTAGKFRARER